MLNNGTKKKWTTVEYFCFSLQIGNIFTTFYYLSFSLRYHPQLLFFMSGFVLLSCDKTQNNKNRKQKEQSRKEKKRDFLLCILWLFRSLLYIFIFKRWNFPCKSFHFIFMLNRNFLERIFFLLFQFLGFSPWENFPFLFI